MRASWTRDEIILGLDVLYSCDGRRINPTNPALVELSELLNRLPIIPTNRRYPAFRNPVGVSSMLRNFWNEVYVASSGFYVGSQFHVVDDEFRNDHTRLHRIAEAIRRNASALNQIPFGDPAEEDGFPEGAILAHLHHIIEEQLSRRYPVHSECEICGIRPGNIYVNLPGASLLALHLLVPPEDILFETCYTEKNTLSVCPNCRRVLHLKRPWNTRKRCGDIISQY